MTPEELRSLLTTTVPVRQPSHLPAKDPSLATEIMPAPPPKSFMFHPPTSHHRKPPVVLSFLPTVDPGSSYINSVSHSLSDGGVIVGGPEAETKQRKRSRSDKSLPPKPLQPATRFPTPSSTAALANGHVPPTTDPSAAPSTRASRRQSPAEPNMPSAPSADGASSRRSVRKVRVIPNYAPVATLDGRPLTTLTDKGPTDPSSWAEYPISDDRNDSKDTMGISTRYGGGGEGALTRRHNFKGRTGDKDAEPGPDAHPDGPQNSDTCASCIQPTFTHPSMSALLISASDQGGGSLLYCDGCPRSFHLLCLNPPIDDLGAAGSLPEGGWYCQECTAEQIIRADLRQLSPASAMESDLFAPLILRAQTVNPVEFQLPEDIRNYFRNVITGPRGGYIDGRRFRFAKGNKQILGEERDPFRLRDRNNRPVLCFRCGGSAVRSAISGDPAMASLDTSSRPPSPTPTSPLPPPDALSSHSSPIDVVMNDPAFAAAPPEAQALLALSNGVADNVFIRVGTKRKREPSPVPSSGANNTESGPRTRRRTEHGPGPSIDEFSVDFGRPVLSCDYCSLHWHMDCLDPPMTGVPAREKKWMCPNHIEHVFAIKPRIPKVINVPTEITKSGQRNSGLVDILRGDQAPLEPTPAPPPKKARKPVHIGQIEELWVGAKKYRVPERVIHLDFWRRVDLERKRAQGLVPKDAKMELEDVSGGSSPLTELSTEGEEDRSSPSGKGIPNGRSSHASKAAPKPTVLPEKRITRGIHGRMNKQELKAFKPYNPGPKKDLPPSRDIPKRVTRQSAPGALPAASPPPAKETPENGEGAMEDTLTDEKEEPIQVELSPQPKPAHTVNSKGGLTLRIPKLAPSPIASSKVPMNILPIRHDVGGKTLIGLALKNPPPRSPTESTFPATTTATLSPRSGSDIPPMLLPTFENPATAPVLKDIPGAPVKKRRPRTARVWGPKSRTGLRNQKSAEPTAPTTDTRETSTDMEVESHSGDAEDEPEVSMNGVENGLENGLESGLEDDPLDSEPVDKERVPSEPAAPRTPPDFIYRLPEEYRSYYDTPFRLHWPEGGIEQ